MRGAVEYAGEMAKRILIWLISAAVALGAEVIPFVEVAGARYRDVKFGPVNDGKVVLYHSHGIATVPVANLPEEYQQRFSAAVALPVPREVKESPPPPLPAVTVKPTPQPDVNKVLEAMRAKRTEMTHSGGNGDWGAYNRERGGLLVLDGKLVDKSTLTPIVGFLAVEKAKLSDGTRVFSGAELDLAERKDDSENVAAAMELRPSLWRRTSERIFLVNYKPMTLPGALTRVYGVEIDPIDETRTFKVGVEPSFEDWKRLPRK